MLLVMVVEVILEVYLVFTSADLCTAATVSIGCPRRYTNIPSTQGNTENTPTFHEKVRWLYLDIMTYGCFYVHDYVYTEMQICIYVLGKQRISGLIIGSTL